MEPQNGILPNIEHLKKCIEDLIIQMETYASKMIPPEKNEEILQILNDLQSRISVLPNSVNRSYELIQMVIHSIHSSRTELRKSVDGLIKKTGMQLQKVTSTTEEATNKILDVAERLDEEQTQIIAIIDNLESTIKQGSVSDDVFTELRAKIYQNQEAAFTIMDYLQFQDITAQQIAGAYSLLSDTEKTLIYVSDLLKNFDNDKEVSEYTGTVVDEKAFNANASFNDKRNVQDAIDDLFSSGNTNIDIPETESGTRNAIPGTGDSLNDDDIDALFAGKTATKDEEAEGTTQDDIDALFGGKKPEPKASQHDIDELFGPGK
jgi:chemotaxis regulatin CheY-phosphate phosphatase CheZ